MEHPGEGVQDVREDGPDLGLVPPGGGAGGEGGEHLVFQHSSKGPCHGWCHSQAVKLRNFLQIQHFSPYTG